MFENNTLGTLYTPPIGLRVYFFNVGIIIIIFYSQVRFGPIAQTIPIPTRRISVTFDNAVVCVCVKRIKIKFKKKTV